jgi:type I restriction enzyme S subunit
MLFCWSGQPETSIGTFWWQKEDGWLNQHIFKVLPNHNIVTKDFFFYILQSLKSHFVEIARNKQTTGLGHVTKKDLERIDVLIPPFEEQKAIAKILSSLDDKIELNRRMNETLEAIARALFKAWFVDFEPVRANMENRPSESASPEVAKLFPAEFENDIPKRWRIGELGEVLELAYGKALKAENRAIGEIPVYGSNGQVGWHNEFLVKDSGIVVGRKGNPGTVVWVDESFFPIDTTFYVKSELDLKFLFYALENLNLPNLGADSAVPGLNRNVACKEKTIIPESTIVEMFGEITSSIYERRFSNRKETKQLAEIRDSLLPRLMSGKIPVSKIDSEAKGENE